MEEETLYNLKYVLTLVGWDVNIAAAKLVWVSSRAGEDLIIQGGISDPAAPGKSSRRLEIVVFASVSKPESSFKSFLGDCGRKAQCIIKETNLPLHVYVLATNA